MHWDELLLSLKRSYYLIAVMSILGVIVLAYGIMKLRKIGTLKILLLQPAATMTQWLLDIFMHSDFVYNNKELKYQIQPISEYIFFIIELAVCTYFIQSNITSKKVSRIIIMYSAIAFAIASFIFWSASITRTSSNMLFAIENIALTISCLLYFIDLFRQPPVRHLLRAPAFWAISGMLLLFSIGTPLFLFFDLLGYKFAIEKIYLINYVLYIILYLTYLKAIQCSQKQPM